MAVTTENLYTTQTTSAKIVQLTQAHLPQLEHFYATWPETVFSPFMFEHGIYYGAFDGLELLAAAGTHAMSPQHHMGVIGNVFTSPVHRGRGLATAVTGAVAKALIANGAREVALNVRQENVQAIRAYSRLGFTIHEAFTEGEATVR